MDNIEKMIIENGYINNNHLHRRYVMTQMLRHLDNFEWYYVHHKPYDYSWTTTLNELDMQCHCDTDERKLRFKLFGKSVVIAMLEDYKINSTRYNKKLDLDYLDSLIYKAKKSYNSHRLRYVVELFINHYPTKVRYYKSKAWISAFKSIGAFYTMDSLIKLYDCTNVRQDEDIDTTTVDEALSWLHHLTSEPTKLFDKMLLFIDDNKLNINEKLLLCS